MKLQVGVAHLKFARLGFGVNCMWGGKCGVWLGCVLSIMRHAYPCKPGCSVSLCFFDTKCPPDGVLAQLLEGCCRRPQVIAQLLASASWLSVPKRTREGAAFQCTRERDISVVRIEMPGVLQRLLAEGDAARSSASVSVVSNRTQTIKTSACR